MKTPTPDATITPPPPKPARKPRTFAQKTKLTGRIMSGLAIAFLIFDGAIKLVPPEGVVTLWKDMGWPEPLLPMIGTILLLCTLVYAIPQTFPLGAVLLTGYLGGAIATHARLNNPLFSHTLFPVYLSVLIWGGLWLRDARLRSLLPIRWLSGR